MNLKNARADLAKSPVHGFQVWLDEDGSQVVPHQGFSHERGQLVFLLRQQLQTQVGRLPHPAVRGAVDFKSLSTFTHKTRCPHIVPAALGQRHQDGHLVMGVLSKSSSTWKKLDFRSAGKTPKSASRGSRAVLYPRPLSRWMMKVSFPNFSKVS